MGRSKLQMLDGQLDYFLKQKTPPLKFHPSPSLVRLGGDHNLAPHVQMRKATTLQHPYLYGLGHEAKGLHLGYYFMQLTSLHPVGRRSMC